ncbi:tol-pal system protein YbgF [Aurantimonas sp. HBX-1]|uniref:tol-pal system protein YbgF n=1 Tax=Aurantimonas sp. HBX-1 TaxID=2906072 RepID=UPI001F28DE46|nr:tol-pal system protein YbgF [Aurantimonas sp. HBX-1]UIJ70819.1 tol-pal system protein YbgF [Aurantimonas sp. HBX-1]
MAQAADPVLRINQLEEEMRRLNGRVEELSFQLLQAQEDMRKYREDTEFRFQDLEGGSGGATPAAAGERRSEAPAAAPAAGQQQAAAAPAATASPADAGSGDDDIGRILEQGLDANAVGAVATTPSPAATPAPAASSTVAAVTPQGQGGMYDLAYNYLLAGDYDLAEQAFRQYSQTYPNAADAPDAEYWLGESLFQQQKFTDAAEVFLTAQKQHPDSGKAPEMMLKLGMSLAKLENRETACITYKEVARRYPQMSANVKRKLESEQKSANC